MSESTSRINPELQFLKKIENLKNGDEMIRLYDIDKVYTNKYVKTFVLRGIELEVGEGEFVSLSSETWQSFF